MIEVKYSDRLMRIFDRQISSFISRAEEVGWQRAYKEIPFINDELLKLITSLYKRSAVTFAPQVARNLRKNLFSSLQTILRFLLENGLKLVTNIDRVTRDEILQIIFDGENAGLGFREIAKLVRGSWITGRNRAITIVRTEAVRAANMSMMESARQNKFILNKVWVSAKDDRVRTFSKKDYYDHRILDGVTLPLEQKFSQVGRKGMIAEAMQPGDQEAPPSFTINCRCVLAFENVRDSQGRLIRKR